MRLGIGPSEYAQRIAQKLHLYNGVLFGCSSLTVASMDMHGKFTHEPLEQATKTDLIQHPVRHPWRNVSEYPSTLTSVFRGLQLVDYEGEDRVGIRAVKDALIRRKMKSK